MKVSIRSLSAFETIKPSDLTAYVQSAGWTLKVDKPGHSSTWMKKTSTGETADLLVPYDRKYKDFVQRVADTVQLLAAVEERSELSVLDDIHTSGMDIFRIQMESVDASDGTVQAERGAEIYESIPQLFTAGACAAEAARIHYGPKKSKDVRGFLQKLRYGQTEFGSYVIRVLSPVSPVVFDSLISHLEDPFERRAAIALMSSLQTLAEVSLPSVKPKPVSASEALKLGLSSNLCSALAKIAGTGMRPQDVLNIRLTPARHRPLSTPTPIQVTFPGETIASIHETARILKDIPPQDGTVLKGYVIKLETKDTGGKPHGPVVVSTILDGKQKKVTIQLSEDEHLKAIEAYKGGLEVSCRGTLQKVGQNWTLLEPSRLKLEQLY